MACAICQVRPPRRYCPALAAEICSPCCGEERERTVQCPFDCEYLLLAREREPMFELPSDLTNADLDPNERFLRAHEPLLLTLVSMLFFAAVKAEATDLDVRAAVATMIDSRRGAAKDELGARAAALREEFEVRFTEFSERAQAEGSAFSEQDVLRILAFLQREELQYNNRRAKSRAYVDWLRGWVTSMAAAMQQQATEDGS